MANISGKAGSVLVAAATVAGIKSWTLDYTGDALDTTDFADSGHRTYIPGIDGWSGKFEGFKDGAPQAIGSEIALQLKESATAGQLYTGQAIITGVHPTVGVDGVVGMAYDFQGSGYLTVATT
jgi:predicted secreted protein